MVPVVNNSTGSIPVSVHMVCIFKRKKTIIPPAGCIPSPLDVRDVLLSSVQALVPIRDLPESYIIPYQLTVLNQNGFPACVGFSAASLKAEKERREQNAIDFDGKWLYDQCKLIDNYVGEGTYLRTVMKVLKDTGAKPLNGLETDIPKYKIGGYAKVDDVSQAGLKSAIIQNGANLAGFTGSNPGWQTANVRPPQAGETLWGHAVTLIGWVKDQIIGLNSWGETWGDKGLFYVPKDYLPFEVWSILVDLPNDFSQIAKPKHTFNINLVLGDQGDEIIWLQKCLKYAGTFPQIIDTTGIFGNVTLRAVQLFQASYNIQNTGNVGPATRTKLNELFSV